MRPLSLVLLALPALASAQLPTRGASFADGSLYAKFKVNLRGKRQQEAGFSMPFLTLGNLSLSGNLGYASLYPRWTEQTGFTAGLSLNYRLNPKLSVYGKTGTDLLNHYAEEVGARYFFYRGKRVTVNSNLAYVLDFPYHRHSAAKWTAGLTVGFPIRSLVR